MFRRRLIFPDLKQHAIRLAREHKAQALLIEDTASGQQLIQTLRVERQMGVPRPTARKPESDKDSRVAGVSAQIEAGQLLLPEEAAWLGEFKAELLGFPNARYDDQVDALAQLMLWVRANQLRPKRALAAPILIRRAPL